MYIEVVLRVERYHDRTVVVSATAQGMASLFRAHYMAEFDEDLAVGSAHQRCVR